MAVEPVCAECSAPLCTHVEVVRGEFTAEDGHGVTKLTLPCQLYLGHPGPHDYGIVDA